MERGNMFNRYKKECYFCKNKISQVDHKDISTLKRYLTFNGRIHPRKKTGACAKHQKRLARAIKRSRQLGFLYYIKS